MQRLFFLCIEQKMCNARFYAFILLKIKIPLKKL